MGKRGGPRPNSGRPPKETELKIIETMDKWMTPVEFWQVVFNAVQKGDIAAANLWAKYRFGMPKQNIELSTTPKETTINVNWDENTKFIHKALPPANEVQPKQRTGDNPETL